MRIQDLFALVLLVIIGCLSVSEQCFASSCFDFSKSITGVLRPARMNTKAEQSGKVSTNNSGDEYWATVQGDVSAPIKVIYGYLSDRNSTKSSRVDEMHVDTEQDPNFLLKQIVHNEVDPFPFVTVKWTDEWAFSLLKGTFGDPKEILISYEKIEGTSHIKHLCGNILITADSDGSKSHVFLYEEAEATGRSQEDTVKGLKGTLDSIRTHAK
jgi:hypothetical protein